jgi:hypothetical protein
MIRHTFWSIAAILLVCSTAVATDIRRVVTGLDDNNHAVVLYDSRVPLTSAPFGIASTNFWITDSYPPSLSKEDTANRPIGVSPPDNGTKFRVVEFSPLDPATEAKLPLEMIMKGVNHPPAKGLP